jgi:hypothetical protein
LKIKIEETEVTSSEAEARRAAEEARRKMEEEEAWRTREDTARLEEAARSERTIEDFDIEHSLYLYYFDAIFDAKTKEQQVKLLKKEIETRQ